MTIKQALNLGTNKLSKSSTSPALDIEVLLSFVLKKEKSHLYSHPEKSLTRKQKATFGMLINRRTKGKPIAYLTGHKEFFGLDFKINRGVSIPRPETETLVELVIEKIKNKKGLNFLDIGTGSGCIVISLAKKLGLKNNYFASDISKKAVAVAKKNAKRYAVQILFKRGDLLKPWKNEKFDITIANLPYLPKLKDKSTKFEPKNALLAKDQGLSLYKKLFYQIKKLPNKPKLLAIEFDPAQSIKIKKLAKQFLPESTATIFKDLTGRNRFTLFALGS